MTINMNRLKFLLPALITLIASNGTWAYYLVDRNTRSTLPLASVTDCDGNLVGMTDKQGVIPIISTESYPLTFSCLGYESLEIKMPVNTDISLTPTTYDLPEIVVSPGSHPLLYLTGYVREVSSMFGSSDSVTIYRESIVDFMIPTGKTRIKGWEKPRELASKTYVRVTRADGTDSVSNHIGENYILCANRFANIPSSIKIPDPLLKNSSTAADTLMGKYGPKRIWQKNGEVLRCRIDGLADFEGHVFTPWPLKALGLTTDITECSHNYAFQSADGIKPAVADMTGFSISLNISIRSKLYRKLFKSSEPICQKSYVEVYITDREYITEEDGKALKKNSPLMTQADVTAPPEASALHPGIRQIIERVESIDTME